jgi:hypothetical protein
MIPSRKKLDLSYIICRSVIESITPIRKQNFYHITTVPPGLAPAHNLRSDLALFNNSSAVRELPPFSGYLYLWLGLTMFFTMTFEVDGTWSFAHTWVILANAFC